MQELFPFLLWCLGPPDVRGVNIYKMLSPNQYFSQQKSATKPERVDCWIPGDQSHPWGIWFAFQLFWHGFGIMHSVPLKVNRCRLNHVANLQHAATHCCSLPPSDSWCGAGAACAKKARLQKQPTQHFTLSTLILRSSAQLWLFCMVLIWHCFCRLAHGCVSASIFAEGT